jgi:hypothetical protein
MPKEPKLERILPKNCYVVVKMKRTMGFDEKDCKAMEGFVRVKLEEPLKSYNTTVEVKYTILEPGVGWPPGAIQGIRPIFKEY